jgi:hypothetical protein
MESFFDECPILDARNFFGLLLLAWLILGLFEAPLPPDLMSDAFLCADAMAPAKLLYGVDSLEAYFLVAEALSWPANKSLLENAAHQTSTKIAADSKVRMI